VNASTTNYAPFAAVQEKIATHIQKSYDSGHDLAKSICTGTLFDLSSEKPIRQLANPNEKKADQELIQVILDTPSLMASPSKCPSTRLVLIGTMQER